MTSFLFLMQTEGIGDYSLLMQDAYNRTVVHPLGLGVILLLGLTTFLIRRERALIPLFMMAMFVSPAQRLVVMGLDFDFIRIMVLFGAFRVIWRGEFIGFQWKPLDSCLVAYLLGVSSLYVMERESVGAFINRLGNGFDLVGLYFFARCCLRSFNDLDKTVLSMIYLSAPMALLFLVEAFTGHNMFSIFGGVPETTRVREGMPRCQGAFSHPIMAGLFCGTLLPLVVSRWWSSTRDRQLTAIGSLSLLTVIWTCASNTPVMGLGAVTMATVLYPLRQFLAIIRWVVVIFLLGVHVTMELLLGEPIWYVFSLMGYGGGKGAYRYNVYQATVEHFDEWAMLGVVNHRWTREGFELHDVTSQYVAEAFKGGVLGLGLFILIIAVAFQSVGRMLRAYRNDPTRVMTAWGLGLALLYICVSFTAVGYFGQNRVLWYFLLAAIAGLTPAARRFSRQQHTSA